MQAHSSGEWAHGQVAHDGAAAAAAAAAVAAATRRTPAQEESGALPAGMLMRPRPATTACQPRTLLAVLHCRPCTRRRPAPVSGSSAVGLAAGALRWVHAALRYCKAHCALPAAPLPGRTSSRQACSPMPPPGSLSRRPPWRRSSHGSPANRRCRAAHVAGVRGGAQVHARAPRGSAARARGAASRPRPTTRHPSCCPPARLPRDGRGSGPPGAAPARPAAGRGGRPAAGSQPPTAAPGPGACAR